MKKPLKIIIIVLAALLVFLAAASLFVKSYMTQERMRALVRAAAEKNGHNTAVIEALASLRRRCRVTVHTDSQYVKLGVTEWLPMWIRRGWKTAGNKAVKNADLWRRLAQLAAGHDIEWRWVKGHAGVPGNERADALANKGAAAASGR